MHPVVALETAGVEMDVLGLTYPEYSSEEQEAVVQPPPHAALLLTKTEVSTELQIRAFAFWRRPALAASFDRLTYRDLARASGPGRLGNRSTARSR
jgi:hypothetical protein